MCFVTICVMVFFNLFMILWYETVAAAPATNTKTSWPQLVSYDIWDSPSAKVKDEQVESEIQENSIKWNNYVNLTSSTLNSYRSGKVLNFFPVPVDDECISDDTLRSGICLNVYECRIQGGTARGECALGFGVCCVFTVSCDQEVKNNITYFVSPEFPRFKTSNLTSCNIKINMINEEISQLRIDFHHFAIGQPNRTTGVCDGDIFKISGGLGGEIFLCGQNFGQHVYYDIGENKTSRQNEIQPESSATNNFNVQTTKTVEITMNFTNRLLLPRLWEIKISQIPFSQRAPVGCLQYFTDTGGIIQTFNFAENGRHLANQNYRACIRQATGMCSIAYEPCNDQSFRIGPTNNRFAGGPGAFGQNPGALGDSPGGALGLPPSIGSPAGPTLADPPQIITPAGVGNADILETAATDQDQILAPPVSEAPVSENPVQADDQEVIEGSGGGADGAAVRLPPQLSSVSQAPVRGGFDIISFLRDTVLDLRRSSRQSRQYRSTCTDRITMPCIIEDFIEAGGESIPSCEPVHCGSNFCSLRSSEQCRIESTVTPFSVGIHFGNGVGKGSPEDNIGACLKYSQMSCT